jgi:hypothetical protein
MRRRVFSARISLDLDHSVRREIPSEEFSTAEGTSSRMIRISSGMEKITRRRLLAIRLRGYFMCPSNQIFRASRDKFIWQDQQAILGPRVCELAAGIIICQDCVLSLELNELTASVINARRHSAVAES